MGGIDLNLRHRQGLAVQVKGLVNRDHLTLGGELGVEFQGKGELRQVVRLLLFHRLQHFILVGLYGRFRRPVRLHPGSDAEGDGEAIGNIVVAVVQSEIQQGPGGLVPVAANRGADLLRLIAGHLGVEVVVVIRIQGEKDIQLLLVHDDVLDGGGDAVHRLALPDGLDVLIFHGGGEGRRPGNGLRQFPQYRDIPAGPGKGHGQVHQQHETGETGRKTAAENGPGPPLFP